MRQKRMRKVTLRLHFASRIAVSVEPMVRFELTTPALRKRCTTTVLHRHMDWFSWHFGPLSRNCVLNDYTRSDRHESQEVLKTRQGLPSLSTSFGSIRQEVHGEVNRVPQREVSNGKFQLGHRSTILDNDCLRRPCKMFSCHGSDSCTKMRYMWTCQSSSVKRALLKRPYAPLITMNSCSTHSLSNHHLFNQGRFTARAHCLLKSASLNSTSPNDGISLHPDSPLLSPPQDTKCGQVSSEVDTNSNESCDGSSLSSRHHQSHRVCSETCDNPHIR